MGCCVSTKKPPASPEFHRHSSKSSRAPPPVVVEEETVKEVLSETPNTHHHFSNKIEQDEERQPTKYNKNLHKIQFHHHHHHQQNHNNLQEMNVSEICSESNSTTTFEEELVEVAPRRRVADRSPAKLRSQISGELRMVRNSPVRGKQQSPGRVRSGSEISNRGSGYYSAGRQRPAPASGQAARSRSPANRTAARGGGGGGGARNGVGRSPSARRTESSPSRAGSGLPERVLKPDLSQGIEREERRWDPNPTDGNDDESLDNPLVSLECFIFL